MSALRQCEGVPEMCVTPAAAARLRKSSTDSAGSDSTSEPPCSAAEEDLQAAVATDVVEGAPGERLRRLAAGRRARS